MGKNATDLFSKYIHGLKFKDFGGDVVESTKLLLLDYLARHGWLSINKIFNEAMWPWWAAWGVKRRAGFFFTDPGYRPSNAAMLNAAFGHGGRHRRRPQNGSRDPGVSVMSTALLVGGGTEP